MRVESAASDELGAGDDAAPPDDGPDDEADDGPDGFELEREQRFSQSLLWQMQRRFFADRGITAWSHDTVPHYITNNPALADALARVALGHLRDQARTRPTAGRSYIVELGAGSGRFAHYFLDCFWPRFEASGLAAPVTYVLTDTVPELLEHWRRHPRLREHIDRGALDFALFDATRPAPLALTESGVTLAPGALDAPLVVIANYVFDSIPCDCFRVTAGALAAGLSTLTVPSEVADPTAPQLISDVDLALSAQPVDGAYYGEPALDAILATYRARLADTTFSFPIAALRCLEYLRSLGAGVLALIADRGIADEQGLHGRAEPTLDRHGSFSLLVNLHALAAYARGSGGRVYQTAHRTERLEVMALAIGLPEAAPETACAFRDAVDVGGPSDAFVHMKAIQRHYDELDVTELLSTLRISRWDPHVFWRCYTPLLDAAVTADDGERREVGVALARIWDMYFPIGESDDLALALASVHYAMAEYDDARWYADHSLRLHGPTALGRYQLALCHYKLGERALATAELEQILAADPGFGPARELRSIIDATAERHAGRRS